MTKEEIFELVSCFDRSSAHTMKLTQGDFSLELSRTVSVSAAPMAQAVPAAPAAPAEDPYVIKAPLVGTFYAASAPDQPPLVKVGDKVAKGQTVCLLEAMKMISEVSAPCECVIEEICKANGELAAFGDTLMRYRPC